MRNLSYEQIRNYFRNLSHPSSIFHSARLKLTGFYLIIILVFSLSLTISIRGLAQIELDRHGLAQRNVFRQFLLRLYSVPPQPDSSLNRFESSEDAIVSRDLNHDVIIINVVALVAGGIVSYWFAGRTLRPIERAHNMQTRFASDASHELRTPLANLRLENELFLKQKKFSEAEARQLITSNLEEVQRLEGLSSHLLSLSKYEPSTIKLQSLAPSKVIKSSIDHNLKSADRKNIKFVKEITPSQIQANFDSLVELLNILIDNAIKYSPKDSTVFINGLKIRSQYHISIRDEGPGIKEEDLPFIFDRLYRGDKSRTSGAGGYGLGLALAKQIAEANGALITARNYPEGGAQFIVSLTIARAK